MNTCSFVPCGYPVKSKGLCNSHYNQQYRGEELRPVIRHRKTCKVDGCERKHHGQGLCVMHWNRVATHGNAGSAESTQRDTDELMRRGLAAIDECVLVPSIGRPVIQRDGASMNFSRAVWIEAHGDPGDLLVLHTCGRGVDGCISLGHLYLGTQKQNVEDAIRDGHACFCGLQGVDSCPSHSATRGEAK